MSELRTDGKEKLAPLTIKGGTPHFLSKLFLLHLLCYLLAVHDSIRGDALCPNKKRFETRSESLKPHKK